MDDRVHVAPSYRHRHLSRHTSAITNAIAIAIAIGPAPQLDQGSNRR